MEDISKKAGYLAGLLENASLPENDDTRKLFGTVAELLIALCDRVQDHEDLLDDLNDYVESIDDDLAAIEEGSPRYDPESEDDVPFLGEGLHVVDGGTNKQNETADVNAVAGCVCPECKAIFLVSMSDPAGSRYLCPSCKSIVLPDALNGDTAQIIKPEPK